LLLPIGRLVLLLALRLLLLIPLILLFA